MNDFTGKELALILKQEAKMKFRLHKLTISKVLDRKGLANALKDLYYSLSIKERLHIIDNLPFIDEEMLAEKLHVKIHYLHIVNLLMKKFHFLVMKI